MNPALKLAVSGLLLVAGGSYLVHSMRSELPSRPAPVLSDAVAPDSSSSSTAAGLSVPQRVDARSSVATAAAPPQPAETVPPATVAISTGSLRLSITWSDGTPAAGVNASVQDVGRSSYDPITGITDMAGECTLDGLRAGKVWVSLDRKEFWDKADIAAGEETALAIQIPRGFDVEGVVVDANGSPVAGASVWLGEIASGPETSFQVATSGDDGSYAIRSCQRLESIWARADGHAPSLCRSLEEPEGTEVSVTLELEGAGAAVAGRVLDPQGQPVEGALVLIDGKDWLRATRITLPDGRTTHLFRSAPVVVRTNADGRFALGGVRPGSVPLGVAAPGYAAWRGTVAAAEGETGETEITLATGFRLTGTVRDSAGQPVTGRVFAYSAALSSQLCPTVMTGPDGGFEIDGLTPGEIRLAADGQAGDAWTTLTGAQGDELTWDALLGPGMPLEAIPIETAPWGE